MLFCPSVPYLANALPNSCIWEGVGGTTFSAIFILPRCRFAPPSALPSPRPMNPAIPCHHPTMWLMTSNRSCRLLCVSTSNGSIFAQRPMMCSNHTFPQSPFRLGIRLSLFAFDLSPSLHDSSTDYDGYNCCCAAHLRHPTITSPAVPRSLAIYRGPTLYQSVLVAYSL
jgi:hypothetical protein